jgi:protein kinase A/protein kinase X
MLKKQVIIKLKQVEHIQNEKAILEAVNNPYIIKLHATFQDERYVYMLFDYICGGEMFSRLRKEGRFANDIALFYTTEIVNVFEYLHTKGIAYRDLKPENLLIDR